VSVDAEASLAERVALYRRRLGLSQVELAARLGRSESWLSQVERGVRSVDRLSVLTRLAQALDVPVSDLSPSKPADAVGPQAVEVGYVDELRLLLSGSAALAVTLGTEDPLPVVAEDARAWAAECWELAHGSRYRELTAKLTEVIPALESGIRASVGSRRRPLQEALTAVYLSASAVLAKLDEPEGAWLAADRAAGIAQGLGRPAVMAGTQWRLALGLLSARRLDQSRHVAENTVGALTPLVADDAAPDLLSVWGALHLTLALVSARDGQRKATRAHLAVARKAAERVGEGRNELTTEFGPSNVAAHAVAAAVELGDAGEALERAEELDLTAFSVERQARVLLDVARAYDQLRRPADALRSLMDAEALAPEQVQDHPIVREVVRSLLQQAGRRPSVELRAFADRLGAAD
jgi:transcriptional regulator with XRE-family HTH domain